MENKLRSKSWIPAADIPSDAGADCDQIAYQYIAAVQPHCLFLNVCRWDRRILNLSENCESLVGFPLTETLGKRCDDTLIEGVEKLLAAVLEVSAKHDKTAIEYGFVCIHGERYVGRAVVWRDRIQVELEKEVTESFYQANPKELLELGAATLRESRRLEDLVPFLDKLGHVLPFCRLGIYRFDEIDHGEVLFERRRDAQVPSYEGLRFPARDIPLAARKMMMSNPLRFTRDRSLMPSKISPRKDPLTGEDIDLSLSRSRGSVGSCQEYYSNMGIRSSLIMPLISDNRLWGMICGHHDSVINITADIDPYLTALGNMISATVKNIVQIEKMNSSERGRAIVTPLREMTAEKTSVTIEQLKQHAAELLGMFPCDGLILRVAGNLITIGAVPESNMIKAYAQKVLDLADSKTLLTNYVEGTLPELAALTKEFAGVLAVPLDTDHGDIAIWLRKEQRREVRWAGAPTQNVRQKPNGSYFLEPRSSFETWSQTMQGISRDWAIHEIDLAESSGMQLSIVLLSWYSIQSNATKSAFLTSVNSQLRTPLTVILGYSELLEKLLAGIESDEAEHCNEYCKIITRSGKNLLNYVNEILDLTRIEAGELTVELVQVDVPKLVQDIVVELMPTAQLRKLRLPIQIIGSVPRHIVTDPARLRQILIHLLSNAIKCTSDGSVTIRLTVAGHDKSLLQISLIERGTVANQEKPNPSLQGLFHADEVIARRFGSFAVGYLISKKVAKLLGGDIDIASHTGRVDITIAMNYPTTLDLIDQRKFDEQYRQFMRRHLQPAAPHTLIPTEMQGLDGQASMS